MKNSQHFGKTLRAITFKEAEKAEEAGHLRVVVRTFPTTALASDFEKQAQEALLRKLHLMLPGALGPIVWSARVGCGRAKTRAALALFRVLRASLVTKSSSFPHTWRLS